MPKGTPRPTDERLLDVRTNREIDAEKRRLSKQRVLLKRKTRRNYQQQKRNMRMVEEELAKRELARRSLLHYIQYNSSKYMAGWVHVDVCRRLGKFLRDVHKGKSPRLMLWLPPRAGKSYMASDMFPSWVLGRFPEYEVILTSYAVSLAEGFSRKIRERLETPTYKNLFRNRLKKNSTALENWFTTGGGSVIAAGVQGSITGKGANIFICDDPVKNQEEADSQTIRDKIYDWYCTAAQTRLAPGAGMLIIQTRWHDDDLSGRLLQVMDRSKKDYEKQVADGEDIFYRPYDEWTVVSYPAIAEHDEWLVDGDYVTDTPVKDEERGSGRTRSRLLRKKGESFHEERFSLFELYKKRNNMSSRQWSALYQQRPVPDEGVFFTKDMFRVTEIIPKNGKVYISGDLAIGEGKENDYTVFVVGVHDSEDNIYIANVVRFRGNSIKILDTLFLLAKVYSPVLVGIERGQMEMVLAPFIKKEMRKRRIYFNMTTGKKALVPVADKQRRAAPLQARMGQGGILFRKDATWYLDTEYELLRFPTGKHDDIVDAMAWLVKMIEKESPPKYETLIDKSRRISRMLMRSGSKDYMSA